MSDSAPSPLFPTSEVQPVQPQTPAGHPQSNRRSGFQEEHFFLVLAIFIGIFSGLLVVCFRVAIEWVRIHLLGSEVPPAGLRMLLAPAATGLVIAVLTVLVFPRVRGSGVNQTKAALYIYNGYVPF